MPLKSSSQFPSAHRLEWRLWKCLVAALALCLAGVKLREWL